MEWIYDRQELMYLLKQVYILTQLRIAVFDSNFRETVSYPQQTAPICRWIASSELGYEACLNCDRQALAAVKESRLPLSYHCHAGIMENISPIIQNGRCIGYIMMGQFLPETAEEERRIFRHRLQELGRPETEGLLLFDSLIRVEPTVLDAAVQMVHTCISYILLHHLIYEQQDPILEQFFRLVDDHLSGRLSIPFLCRKLGVGKTFLCQKIKAATGRSINQYILDIRMNKARELLRITDLQVGEIARRTGFADYNYFSKVFKKSTGCTPRDFRRNNRISAVKSPVEMDITLRDP